MSDALHRLEALQQESCDMRVHVESSSERVRSIRGAQETRDEQFRSLLDRLERENADSRLKALQGRLQDLETVKVSSTEQLQILQQRLENYEQDFVINPLAVVSKGLGHPLSPNLDSRCDDEFPEAASCTLSNAASLAEVKTVRSRLEQLEDRIFAIGEQTEAVLTDQALAPHISALVLQLKDVAPKVIVQETEIVDLKDKVNELDARFGLDLCKVTEATKGLDSLTARTGRVEVEVHRLVAILEGDREAVVESREEEDELFDGADGANGALSSSFQAHSASKVSNEPDAAFSLAPISELLVESHGRDLPPAKTRQSVPMMSPSKLSSSRLSGRRASATE
eukprot:TRINITY_DN86971_c0_g1_i1.p1 TRINITY_DN86971_c0_g1~~TRINITY_DN86971_c0_g1_i1.p1  ORF type:complete len:340 (-),score=61.90 TRINITY_DN86971_c0_g1_i1:119-1138(-)